MEPTHSTTTTPRKRKNLTLANLQSSLSEKYIGIVPAVAGSPDTMITRQLRGRLSNGNIAAANAVENLSPISQTTPPRKISKKPFISPIDKLLLKNGSTAIMPIHDHSPRAVDADNLQPKKSNSISTFLMTDYVDVESLIPFNRIEDDRDKVSKNSADNTLSSNADVDVHEKDGTHTIVQEEESTMAVSGPYADTTEHDVTELYEANKAVQRTVSQDESSEFAIELENVDSEKVLGHSDSTNKDDNDNVKSPSAVSLDSAKGSSVGNETTWINYAIGDLHWGQIFSYCYWPCLVCPDPDERIVITEENSRNGEPQVLVHVRFFADNGRRNWVKSENLMPYYGLQSYEEYVDEVRNKYGSKSLKYKVLVPKGNKKTTWYEAINEANMLVDVVHSKRLDKFFSIYEQTKNMQQMERRLSQTTYTPIDLTSDFGSICDSSEALSIRQSGSHEHSEHKRERSSSPFSPAYSPLKSVGVKRRKMRIENNAIGDQLMGEEQTLSESDKLQDWLNMNTQEAKEFKRFYAVMRDYVMDSNNDIELERSLVRAVHNIWELREISQMQTDRRMREEYDEQELGSSLVGAGRNDGKIKRLSNRLRSIIIKRHSMPTSSISSPSTSVAHSHSTSYSIEKPKKVIIKRPIETVIDDIYKLDSKYLFKGLGREAICKYCYQSGDLLLQCDKNCQSWLHAACADQQLTNTLSKKRGKRPKRGMHLQKAREPQQSIENQDENEETDKEIVSVTCIECRQGGESVCRVCLKPASDEEQLISCNMQNCNVKFHPGCCRYWPQAKITKSQHRIESFRCPSHVCHTCVSDDPKGKFQHLSNAKITRCIKCPASFHTDSTCIPAGSQILNAAHIICPRHSSAKTNAAVNVNWCFICVGGGQLVCCETCPIAVHAQCLNIPIATHEAYICEECESGRMPLYGEMVWAKFNMFRWWPAIILPPPEVPQNIFRKAHGSSEFVVRFFGTHDHGWISRNRVYVYLEGDASEPPKTKSSMDLHYKRGIEEAKRIYELVKTHKMALKNENKEKLYPQPFTRIKTNRPVPPVKLHIDLNKVNVCDCKPDDANPCGAETDCLNRVLYHECHPKMCPAGERCENQMFESRVSPRLEVVYMRERGFGLVCRESIAAGSFIIEYVGEIINQEEFQQRLAQKSVDRDENYYFFTVEKDYIIDAGPKGNLARFMNHSCEPNCETQKWLVNGLNRVGLFALKDIPENTELTFNYNWDELLGKEKKSCYCGAAKCAGEIGGKYREDKTKDDVKSLPKEKGVQKKTNKPLKRLQKQKWKITPRENTKSSKVNTATKQTLNQKVDAHNTPKSKIQNASSDDLVHTTEE